MNRMRLDSELVNELKARLNDQELTQAELAKRLGIRESHLSRVLRQSRFEPAIRQKLEAFLEKPAEVQPVPQESADRSTRRHNINALRALRLRLGITQGVLAIRSALSLKTVARTEKGQPISESTVFSILTALNQIVGSEARLDVFDVFEELPDSERFRYTVRAQATLSPNRLRT